MHIVHVTPHLPPDQAANALLPWQLGTWAVEAGDTVAYVAHPPRATGQATLAGPVTWVPRRTRGVLDGGLPVGAVMSAWRIWRTLGPAFRNADVVHVHSNGLLAELAVLLGTRSGLPVVLTLYGTEIWHYAPKRFGPDLFTRAYGAASVVTFYSNRLEARAKELGLERPTLTTVHPAVGSAFRWSDPHARAAARAALGITSRNLLLNVKRLHPLAGQRDLLTAMPEVIRAHPDTALVICGTGSLLAELVSTARAAGIERYVTFAGLEENATIATCCAAADLFVLPSILEALPTVAVEALAAGTPVLSSDNPGGLELNEIFGEDVAIVPREQPALLAAGIIRALDHPRRTSPATQAIIERDFRAAAVLARFRRLYEEARQEATR